MSVKAVLCVHCVVELDGVDRKLDFLSRESEFESAAILFTPHSHSALCIKDYLAIDSGGYVNE